jgi:hypothetical protein
MPINSFVFNDLRAEVCYSSLTAAHTTTGLNRPISPGIRNDIFQA